MKVHLDSRMSIQKTHFLKEDRHAIFDILEGQFSIMTDP